MAQMAGRLGFDILEVAKGIYRKGKDSIRIIFAEKDLTKTKRRVARISFSKYHRLRELVLEKIQWATYARNIKLKHAHWDMPFFGVNKGDHDIRIA